MYTDAQLRPSNAQSLVGAAATTVSTNTIDLLSAANNLGIGFPRRAVARVGTAFTGGTSVKADLISSASADLSSPTVLVAGVAVVTANAVAGAALLDVVIPNTAQRYIGFQYTTVGTTTTGTVNAHIVTESDHQPYLTANLGR